MQHLLEVLKIIDGGLTADRGKVVAYAEQLAAKLDSDGESRAAESVRKTLRGKAGQLSTAWLAASKLPVDSESRLSLADEQMITNGEVSQVVLSPSIRARIDEFVSHVREGDKLVASGVGIAPSMLMYGPPGCGKTELARSIACQLGLPLLTSRADTLISSYLGSTAKNLRLLFDHARSRPCVLFLDEFDSLAKLRDDRLELGELKRVVISLLQNIDALQGETVLLAATNHHHLLDRAVWRRFAYRLEVGLPDEGCRELLFGQYLGAAVPFVNLTELARVSEGFSGADIRQLCEEARRAAILKGEMLVDELDLLTRLARTKVQSIEEMALPERLQQLRAISPKLYTVRKLAAMFDISVGKVSNLIREGNHDGTSERAAG